MITPLLQSRRGIFMLALYFFSGVVALAYEVLWARMLSLQFGISIFGAVVTVTAFMVGLGLGSMQGVRWAAVYVSPLRAFAICEFAVSVFALTIPVMLRGSSSLIDVATQGASLTTWYAVQLGADVMLLTLPAFAMGAGFSFMLHAARASDATLARLYGINALGGTIGALLPLVLLPALGWYLSTQIFAVLGLVIAGSAWRIDRADAPQSASVVSTPPPKQTLLLYAVIGAASLMLEVGWTRLYGMIMLRTEYVLAVIIAVFLAGIGIGSILARRMTSSRWILIMPIVAASCAVATVWLLAPVSRVIESSHYGSLFAALVSQGGLLIALTLPATLALGAWLPLLAARVGDETRHGAYLYGVNSLGAALGASIAGFVLIPNVGTTATIGVAALLLVVSGLLMANARRAWLTVPVLGIFAALSAQLPSVAQLLPRSQGDTHDVYFREDAVSITHVIERGDGQRLLLDDLQRMDAASDPDAVAVQRNQARLPLLLHPMPQRVLFLGMGTGISASGALPYANLDITAVELSQGAIEAAQRWFDAVNDKVTDHVHIVRDDARRFLVRDTQHYDVIIGDLFHPDLAGRSALLSVQQFERARARLSAGGVFVQWIALNQFDVRSFEIVLRSFARVFPEATLYLDPFRIALVGTTARAPDPTATLSNLARLPDAARDAVTGGEGPWTWWGRYWGKARALVTAEGPVQDENAPRIEYLLPKARYRGDLDLAVLLQMLLKQRPRFEQVAQELNVVPEQRAEFERAYAATELAQASWLAALRDKPDEAQRLLRLAYQANPQDRWIGFALVGDAWSSYEDAQRHGGDFKAKFGKSEREVLEAILRIRPDHVPALKALAYWHERRNETEQAQRYWRQAKKLSPLDRDLRDRP